MVNQTICIVFFCKIFCIFQWFSFTDTIFRPEKKYFQNGEKNGEILFFMEIIHSLWRKNTLCGEKILFAEIKYFSCRKFTFNGEKFILTEKTSFLKEKINSFQGEKLFFNGEKIFLFSYNKLIELFINPIFKYYFKWRKAFYKEKIKYPILCQGNKWTVKSFKFYKLRMVILRQIRQGCQED